MYRIAGASTALALALLMVGCQQPQTDMAEMMKAPPRPAELDRLEAFVGTWEGTAEMMMPDSEEVEQSSGTETVKWGADERFLVSHYEYDMGEGNKMVGLGVWTWDAKAKKYRMWSFDNLGTCSTGTAKYDADNQTWYFKGKSRNATTGETTTGKGMVKMVDADTQEWTWSEWDRWGFRKQMDLKGTSHRK